MSGATERYRRRVDMLFDQALDRAPEAREAFLREACGDDRVLLEDVQALLELAGDDEPLPGAMRTPQDVDDLFGEEDLSGAADVDRWVGARLGAYRIVEPIARGGMAVVYLAERVDGTFRQRAALKLIKRGLDTEEVLRRFDTERQILAQLTHPNIARLLDGGSTEDGRPYFVMEHVDGQPIDRYCDERRLGVAQRLRLFLKVADAVRAAHRHLVIHRDIKPSNILVTADGDVKLLDFGIAQVLADDPDMPASAPTVTGRRFLTPGWCSPEQYLNKPMTTSSDVYQLGLLLQALLAGRPGTPSDGTEDPSKPREFAGLLKTIPRRALTELAAQRGLTPKTLRRRISGDLENIVGMALRQNPERRYGSVDQLREDIARHLDGRPVDARADRLGYRLSRTVRRHPAASIAAAVALSALLALAATSTVQARRIAAERDRANRESETNRQISELLTGLFRIAAPSEARGNTVTAREILDRGAAQVDATLTSRPLVRGRMLSTMAEAYDSLGLHGEAQRVVEASRRAFAEAGDPDPDAARDRLYADYVAASNALRRQDFDAASELIRRTLAGQAALLPPQHRHRLKSRLLQANLDLEASRLEQLEADFLQLIEDWSAVEGASGVGATAARGNLAVTYNKQGRYAEAEAAARRAIEDQLRLGGPDDPSALNYRNFLANAIQHQERYADAEPLYRELVDDLSRVLGPDHPRTLTVQYNLARLLIMVERFEEAEPLLRANLEGKRRNFGGDNAKTLRTLNAIGDLLSKQGRFADAAEIFEEAWREFRKVHGDDHPETRISQYNLATALRDQGQPREARPHMQAARDAILKRLGEEHPITQSMSQGYRELLEQLGEPVDSPG